MARSPTLKLVVIGAVLAGLLGVLALAVVHETGAPVPAPLVLGEMVGARPALTGAEEAYASALWPIHEEVKNSAVRMTFAGLSYKLDGLDKSTVKSKVAPLTEVYRSAAERVGQLHPPDSLMAVHQQYLEALRLYRDSSVEMVKVADDGRDEHLIAAQGMSERAAVDLLKVGNKLWPGEYKPN
jgi:hypothetical protein